MYAQLISDKELIRRYVDGNEAALEVLIDRYKERIYTYIMMLVRDRQMADDIFQDTFIKVINSLKRGAYNEEGKFMPWVSRIAHNLVVDNYRREKHMPKVRGDEDFDILNILSNGEASKEEEMIAHSIRDKIRELIELLPDDQKEVLKMRHYARMSFKDIAEETNVSINTALGRMRYALINLRKLIREKQLDLIIS